MVLFNCAMNAVGKVRLLMTSKQEQNRRSCDIRNLIARAMKDDNLWRDTEMITSWANRHRGEMLEYLPNSTIRYHLLQMVKNNELERRVKSRGWYAWAQYRKGDNFVPF